MLPEARVKYFASLKQKKFREKENRFLIEGLHLLEECLKSEYRVDTVIICESLLKSKLTSITELITVKNIPLVYLKNKHFAKISDTDSPQGIIAVVEKQTNTTVDYSSSELIVALDGISDPGNLGTIIRTCHWFGVSNLLINKHSVDMYNQKVLRSTQGSIFHVNTIDNVNLAEELSLLNKNGFNIVLFDVNAKDILNTKPSSKKNVLVFGNEINGISEEILNSFYNKVKINGYSECESLNLSVSCGIALNFFKN